MRHHRLLSVERGPPTETTVRLLGVVTRTKEVLQYQQQQQHHAVQTVAIAAHRMMSPRGDAATAANVILPDAVTAAIVTVVELHRRDVRIAVIGGHLPSEDLRCRVELRHRCLEVAGLPHRRIAQSSVSGTNDKTILC